MTTESLATLVNIGAAGAVVAVVGIFLQFIAKRDEDWQSFFTAIRQADSEANTRLATVIDKLIERVESLENKFDQHDATEMEILRGLAVKKPPPRKL